MFRVKTFGYGHDLPFYPLPYRTQSGSILFPANVHGIYMRDLVFGPSVTNLSPFNPSPIAASPYRAACLAGAYAQGPADTPRNRFSPS